MIKNVINSVTEQLNDYVNNRFPSKDSKVVVSNLIGQDGRLALGLENKIICSVINIEQEHHLSIPKHSAGGLQATAPSVYLNIYLMFSANFTDNLYTEGLQFLSLVTEFFQSKAVFTPNNTPNLASANEKITFEIHNIEIADMSNLWGAIGANYIPSIIYKAQRIEIGGTQTQPIHDI